MALAFSTLETTALTPDEVTCRDFQAFQLQLKKLRFVDDRIVNELNSEIIREANPTAKCHAIHDLIVSSHDVRGWDERNELPRHSGLKLYEIDAFISSTKTTFP